MDVGEGEVVEGQGVGEPVVPGVVGMKRGDNGLLAGDNGAFPGTLVCPYGSEEQWAALLDASTAEGKRIRDFMDQMRPEGQGRGVSRRLWLATPEAAFVCGGCFTSFKKLSVHEISGCPAAVARGDQPPEPKSSDLHEAPTPSDGLRVIQELVQAAIQAKAWGGGEPEGKEVEGHGAGEGAGGHKAVPKPQPSAPGARGRAQPPVLAPAVLRATVESFRTCMGDLFAFEQCAGLGEDDATRMANMRTAMARMDRGAFAVLASLPAGQKVLELIQDPASEEWLTTVGSAQFMQVRMGLERIAFSLERALTTMTASAASAAAPQSGASGGPGALKLVTLGVDLTAYHVGAVVSQDGIQYVRLQGTTAGVQLLKRKEGDVSDHGPLLALRLGVPRVVGENRGVLQHMRQASRGVTSGAGVVPGEVWRGQVGNAVQRGQVPVLAGAIPGVITGAGQRWLAAFNAYRTMVTRAHCEADPLRVQLATLIGGRSMDLAIQKHGVVMVDGVWDSVVDEYNNDMVGQRGHGGGLIGGAGRSLLGAFFSGPRLRGHVHNGLEVSSGHSSGSVSSPIDHASRGTCDGQRWGRRRKRGRVRGERRGRVCRRDARWWSVDGWGIRLEATCGYQETEGQRCGSPSQRRAGPLQVSGGMCEGGLCVCSCT